MSDKVTHISQLNFDQRNPRKHNPRNIGVVVDSLQKVGAARSIVIDENNQILAGNGVTEAATLAGIEKVVEVEADGNTLIAVRRRDLTDEQKQALKYYDNRSGELAEWSADVILADFEAGAVDFSQLWNEAEWSDLLEGFGSELLGRNGAGGEPAEVTETEAEKLQQKWQTSPGQIWQLGRHKIACLDSTDEETVKRLVGDLAVGMVWADPPYGIGLDTTYKNSLDNPLKGVKASRGYAPVIGDNQSFDPTPFFKMIAGCKEQFWWGADYYCDKLPGNGSWLVWDKRDGMEVDWTAAEFELCWSKTPHHRQVIKQRWFGLIGTEQEPDKRRFHPTQKPVKLFEWFAERYAKDNWLIFDPFLGSGPSILGAERIGRGLTVIGCELSPDYIAVCLQRWADATGCQPERVSG